MPSCKIDIVFIMVRHLPPLPHQNPLQFKEVLEETPIRPLLREKFQISFIFTIRDRKRVNTLRLRARAVFNPKDKTVGRSQMTPGPDPTLTLGPRLKTGVLGMICWACTGDPRLNNHRPVTETTYPLEMRHVKCRFRMRPETDPPWQPHLPETG